MTGAGQILAVIIPFLVPVAAQAVLPGYNYCGNGQGHGFNAPPTNSLDGYCKDHDRCYQPAMAIRRELSHLHGQEREQAWRRMQQIKCGCDQEFLRGIDAMIEQDSLPPSMKVKAQAAKAFIHVKGSCHSQYSEAVLD